MIALRLSALLQTFAGSTVSKCLSLRRRFHPPPFSPKVKYAAPDRRGLKAFDHTCFVPSGANPWSVTSVSDMPGVSTNLKRGFGNTKDSLFNCVQLSGVNLLLVLCGSRRTYLCEDSAIFNRPVHRLLYHSAHQWSVFL